MCTCFPVQQSMSYQALFVVASPSTYLATDLSDIGRIFRFGDLEGGPAIKVLVSVLTLKLLSTSISVERDVPRRFLQGGWMNELALITEVRPAYGCSSPAFKSCQRQSTPIQNDRFEFGMIGREFMIIAENLVRVSIRCEYPRPPASN